MSDLKYIPFILVLVLGCDNSKSPDENTAQEGVSDSANGSEGGVDSDAGASSGASPTSGSATSGGASTSAGESGGEASTGTDSAASCDLNEVVNDAVDGGTVPANEIVDCGTVVADDDANAWVDMRDCIVDAAANQRAYKGFVHRNNGLEEAFGSVVGAQYDTQHWLLTDSGKVFMERCSEVRALPDCEPTAESGTCVACFGEGNQVCPAD